MEYKGNGAGVHEKKEIPRDAEVEDDEWDDRIRKSGCYDQHVRLQDCFWEHKDWRKCSKELLEFKNCFEERHKDMY